MGLLSDLFKLFADAIEDDVLLDEQNAKKTLCCGVKMWDLWSHDKLCPQVIANSKMFVEWKNANPDADLVDMPNFDVRPYGDRDGLCPDCGFPTNHFGIYTVGKKCSYCGHVETRKSGIEQVAEYTTYRCNLPPEGWWCSRKRGHKGPCAARMHKGIPHEGERKPWRRK